MSRCPVAVFRPGVLSLKRRASSPELQAMSTAQYQAGSSSVGSMLTVSVVMLVGENIQRAISFVKRKIGAPPKNFGGALLPRGRFAVAAHCGSFHEYGPLDVRVFLRKRQPLAASKYSEFLFTGAECSQDVAFHDALPFGGLFLLPDVCFRCILTPESVFR